MFARLFGVICRCNQPILIGHSTLQVVGFIEAISGAKRFYLFSPENVIVYITDAINVSQHGKKYFSVHWSALENERLFLLEKPLKFLSKITATWKNYSALQFLQIAKICHLVIAYMCRMYVILSSKIIFVAFCNRFFTSFSWKMLSTKRKVGATRKSLKTRNNFF